MLAQSLYAIDMTNISRQLSYNMFSITNSTQDGKLKMAGIILYGE